MKLTPEEIADRRLILHPRKHRPEFTCPACGRDCGSGGGLVHHREVCRRRELVVEDRFDD
jgi:predicted RNA-binding Zn-ribbon protein involved in translation (DUF1610 family)